LVITVPGSSIAVANSTTYIDLLGVLLGVARLPGENSYAFAERLQIAAVAERTADYIGLMNELCLQFGFNLQQALSIDGDPALQVSVDLMGVHLAWTAGQTPRSLTSPLMTIGPDVFWEWRKLSDIVSDINATGSLTAGLLGIDGPAFCLARQSNQVLALAEPIDGQVISLDHQILIAGSEQFNQPVPAYTISGSQLSFVSPVPSGTTVTYTYLISPYYLVSSPVFLLSLSDPSLPGVAVNANQQMVYQVKEFVQELVRRDLSYWAV
jgi:hypothetical protein